MKIIATNKKANFLYEVLDKFTAGIVLTGWEVKSLRNNTPNLDASFIYVDNGEAFIKQMFISEYKYGYKGDVQENFRLRKLLLNKKEIQKLDKESKNTGFSIVPLKIYFNDNNRVKVDIALVKGLKNYDKRDKIKKRDMKLDTDRKLSKI